MTERRGTIVLLLGAAGWIVACVAGAIAAVALVGLCAGYGVLGLTASDKFTYVLAGAIGFQGTMLAGAMIQGRWAGRGNLSAGLGIAPIRRGRLVALCCVAAPLWIACFVGLTELFPALRDLVKSATPDLLANPGDLTLPLATARVALLAVLAPVSEEFFFRGWLWESLRRRGHALLAIALLTAVPWLLLHGLVSPWRVAFLVPAAVIFTAARCWGGGVLGSLPVHLTNNAVVVAVQLLGETPGHG